MVKKIGMVIVGATLVVAQCLIGSTAFALLQDDGTPCPPECVTDSMEIVTWYPSPYNEYEELRLYPKRSSEESRCDSFEQLGLMYYNQDEQALKVCWQDPSDLSYSWEKIPSEQSGLLRLGNYATGYRPNCSNAILGALVYDTTEKRPYVCALNASNSPVWKPLDSDYDRDGVTDAVDYNDNDLNDATAVEANVETGKTFYARGGSRRTGTLAASGIGGVCTSYKSAWTHNSPITCADGSWHAWADGYLCESVLGNAFCDTGSACGGGGINGYNWWWWADNPCRCPAGYALTEFKSYDPEGNSNWAREFYCKKN